MMVMMSRTASVIGHRTSTPLRQISNNAVNRQPAQPAIERLNDWFRTATDWWHRQVEWQILQIFSIPDRRTAVPRPGTRVYNSKHSKITKHMQHQT